MLALNHHNFNGCSSPHTSTSAPVIHWHCMQFPILPNPIDFIYIVWLVRIHTGNKTYTTFELYNFISFCFVLFWHLVSWTLSLCFVRFHSVFSIWLIYTRFPLLCSARLGFALDFILLFIMWQSAFSYRQNVLNMVFGCVYAYDMCMRCEWRMK